MASPACHHDRTHGRPGMPRPYRSDADPEAMASATAIVSDNTTFS
jgi:hypothetical protein